MECCCTIYEIENVEDLYYCHLNLDINVSLPSCFKNVLKFILNSQRTKMSPKVVAQRTGAARFEEYLDDDSFSSHESKVKKRLAQDPDIDPIDKEIYQGVLGRPGVDFPVMTTIPPTDFDCHNFGNGYFADLDTSCQV